MSHCPGYTLEDWITDWYRIVDDVGQHGTGIRRFYSGQLILNSEQFKKLVEIHEPIREYIENLLYNFDEEEQSWRDYCSVFTIPEPIGIAAEQYINSIMDIVEKTKGLKG